MQAEIESTDTKIKAGQQPVARGCFKEVSVPREGFTGDFQCPITNTSVHVIAGVCTKSPCIEHT